MSGWMCRAPKLIIGSGAAASTHWRAAVAVVAATEAEPYATLPADSGGATRETESPTEAMDVAAEPPAPDRAPEG